MVSFDLFPDLCLFTIFDHLPIVDLIQIDAVCRRWAALQATAFARRRSLLLIQNKTDLEMLRRAKHSTDLIEYVIRPEDKGPLVVTPKIEQLSLNAIKLGGELHPAITGQLVARFPEVAHLTVVQREVSISALEQIIALIGLYGAHLRSLAIYFWYNDQMIGFDDHNDLLDIVNGLFVEINQLPQLRHLTLNLDLPNLGLNLHLPILTQLLSFSIRTFGLNYHEDSDLIAESLAMFAAPNQTLKEMDIANPVSLGVLLQLDRSLWSKFTRLVIEDLLDDDEAGLYLAGMARFCQRFTNLTTLGLQLGSLSLVELSPHLAKLPKLLHLELSTRQIAPPRPKCTIAPVFAVKLLTLFLSTQSHLDPFRLHLPEIFPQVQAITWTHSSTVCRDCEYSLGLGEKHTLAENRDRVEACMKLARGPLRSMASLHTVNFNEGPCMPWTRKVVNAIDV